MLYASWLPNSIIQSCSYKRQAENLCAYVIFHEKEETLYFPYLNLWKRAKILLKLYQIFWIDTVTCIYHLQYRVYKTYNIHFIPIWTQFFMPFIDILYSFASKSNSRIEKNEKCWINCVIFIRLNHQFSLDWWPSIWVIISIFVIDEYKTFLLTI